MLKLSASRLALANVSFLVDDDDLSCENLLVGFPVLHHLGIDSSTLLERSWVTLDGTDCSSINHSSMTKPRGTLGCLIITRLQREYFSESEREIQQPNSNPERPRGNYFAHKLDIDPFPDPNLIGLANSKRDKLERQDLESMLQRAKHNGFPDSH